MESLRDLGETVSSSGSNDNEARTISTDTKSVVHPQKMPLSAQSRDDAPICDSHAFSKLCMFKHPTKASQFHLQ
jgi:hypothetical protein